MLVLYLAVLQGTSFTLTLAVRFQPEGGFYASLVTLLWLATYGMAFLGLILSFGANWLTWLVRYRLPLTLLLAGVALSTAWSIDTNLSAERSVHLIGSTLVALYLGFSLPLTTILTTTAKLLGALVLFSLLAAVFYPEIGLEHYEGQLAWRGVMASKNTLGFWSAIAILLHASLLHWPQSLLSKLTNAIVIGIATVCLIYSSSATAVLALMIAALLMAYMYTAFSFRLGLVAMIVLGLLVCALAGLAFWFIDTAELIGRSGDLTGRGEVWSQTWQLVLEKPLTGYGYGTLWFPTDASLWIQQSLFDFTWTVFHAHNGLLQVASEIGLPLTSLMLLLIIQQLIEIIYCQYQRQQQGVLFVLGFTVALLVSNYSEARLLVNRELYWIFFIALPISMLQQVTVLAQSNVPLPIPIPLSSRLREKVDSGQALRAQRQALKKKLDIRHQRLAQDADVINVVEKTD